MSVLKFSPNSLRAALFSTLVILVASVGFSSRAQAIETNAKQAILIDAQTMSVLYQKDGFVSMPPASMSKLMTLYLLFERLRDGRLSLDDTLRVSERAWRKGGAKSGSSTMFLKPGQRVRIEDLIRGIIVQSGNDACIVVAEGLAGTEDAFAAEMTSTARELGLQNSHFANATGWPDPGQRMTAYDLALLARHLIYDFPEYYHYFSEKSFTYNGIKQQNRDPLVYQNTSGADGLKTGHTEASGYGLVASAKRNGRRLILVLNGLASKKLRASEPEHLLDWGFREFQNYALFKSGDVVDQASVWLGKKSEVPLIVKQDVTLTLPRKSRKEMKVQVVYDGPVPAPIAKGQHIADLVISAPDVKTVDIPLVAGDSSAKLGLFGRLGAAFNQLLWGSSQPKK
ncbi:D-alanyl-D-alanine carboxypeptidase family protein [Varunaivibrio sulfuroxidans]|nr:D-alanyl-D-alanine carboxypeptidase family protein [Varunaivibrio sulfuroxidans]WES31197.1 D-alanyl-D-alanine carboxypeptidase [Varunaivibrio sulfuroxidans]